MRTLIAIPCMDMIHTNTVISLTGLRLAGEVKFAYAVSSLVYDARNSLARQAIVENYDRVLWLDSDMEFSPDLYEKLSADLDEGRDIVSAFYVTRKGKIKPVIFDKCGYERLKKESNEIMPYAHTYYDYPQDSIFEIEACGFGGVLMNTSVLKKVEETYGLPFAPILGFGEDISFCMRAREAGFKVWCDSRVKMGHIGNHVFSEEDYERTT